LISGSQAALIRPLQEHLRRVHAIHEQNLADGYGRVESAMEAIKRTLLAFGFMLLSGCVRDKIVVDSVVPGEELGILYDGADRQGTFNDRGVICPANTTTATVTLPNIRAPAFGNSLVAFSRSRQPRRVLAPWTPNTDTVYVPLQNNIRFNVTFWILAGPFTTQQTNAAAAVLAVNNAYTLEKAGVRIAFVTVNDATTNPNAAALMGGGTRQQFETGIGFNPGEINVYVINTVNGGSGNGLNFDGTPIILLGQNALTFPQLLEHEIGHAFVLWHVGPPDFNWQNVMAPSVSAHFLTEGQTFRMHFHPSSQINVFNLRPGQPTFVCGEPATNDCPANSRRLWQDGDLPPN
jgi:hypothetical protein